MDPVRTHLSADRALVGEVVSNGPGAATCALVARPEMAVDDRGLVHGSFVFGLADLAAMVAVNDPNVVLGESAVRFVAPVRVGQRVVATARVATESGRKRVVDVSAEADGVAVLTGTFTAFVLDRHVLDTPRR